MLDAEFQHEHDRRLARAPATALLPAAPVYDLPQALDNPYRDARSAWCSTVPHPLRPDFRVLANPIKLDGARLPARAGARRSAPTPTPCCARLRLHAPARSTRAAALTEATG